MRRTLASSTLKDLQRADFGPTAQAIAPQLSHIATAIETLELQCIHFGAHEITVDPRVAKLAKHYANRLTSLTKVLRSLSQS